MRAWYSCGGSCPGRMPRMLRVPRINTSYPSNRAIIGLQMPGVSCRIPSFPMQPTPSMRLHDHGCHAGCDPNASNGRLPGGCEFDGKGGGRMFTPGAEDRAEAGDPERLDEVKLE